MKKQRRRNRINPIIWIILIGFAGAVWYFEQFVVTELPTYGISATATPPPDPEQIITQARENFDQGNLIRAIELYQQAVLYSPGDSTVHVELARTQILSGQYEAAQTSAQNALLLNPENPSAHAYLGWVYVFLEDYNAADRALKQALSLNPEHAEAIAFLAEMAADQQQYEEAANLSKQALALDSNSLEVRRARAYVLQLTANYEEAVIAYQAALQINDKIADLHMGLGLSYWSLGNYEGAIDEFNLADSLNPLDPLPDAYISRIYLTQGEYAKSIQFAKKSAQDDPFDPRRYGNWGVALFRNLQYEDAIKVFSLAVHGGVTDDNQAVVGLTLDYDVAEYFYMYGLALARLNRCTEALPIAQALLAAVPGDEYSVANAGAIIDICDAAALITPSPVPTLDVTPTPEN